MLGSDVHEQEQTFGTRFRECSQPDEGRNRQ